MTAFLRSPNDYSLLAARGPNRRPAKCDCRGCWLRGLVSTGRQDSGTDCRGADSQNCEDYPAAPSLFNICLSDGCSARLVLEFCTNPNGIRPGNAIRMIRLGGGDAV